MTPKEYVMLIFAVIGAMSFISFCAMGLDKYRAIKRKRRTPEKRLFLYAILLGATGGTVGMYTFHHKTQHWYFVIGMPLILLLQIAGAVYLLIFVLN